MSPQPPGLPPSSPRSRRPHGWALALIVAFAAVLVAVPATIALMGAGDDAGDSPTPTAAPGDPTAASASPSDPATTGNSAESSDGAESGSDGDLGELVEGLLGGAGPSPMQLAACVGTPTGSPEPLPADQQDAIDAIAGQVQAIRNLELTEPIDPELLPADELRDRVVTLTRRDYPAEVAAVDARLLVALGAIEPATDLRQVQVELLGDQVAGFYDPETGELTALASDGLDPSARIALAHEIDHALTDQALGLPDLEGFDGRSDAKLAALAMVEGDATLLMQRWAMQQLSLLDQIAAAMAAAGPAQQLQDVPWYLKQALLFPYTTGLGFVCDQFASGGWDAVNALYDDPPTTSAQVMWPVRYTTGDERVDVPDPQLPGGWDPVRRDQLGAADLLWLFQAPGNDRAAGLSDPEQRARAWAGGELVVGTRGDDTVVAVTLAEHAGATPPLCDSITAWYAAAFPDATSSGGAGPEVIFDGPRQDAAVDCDDGVVRVGIGPDTATARAAADTG